MNYNLEVRLFVEGKEYGLGSNQISTSSSLEEVQEVMAHLALSIYQTYKNV